MHTVENARGDGLSESEVERARAHTPGVLRTLQLDHAGSSPAPAPVHERVVAHLEREREIGGYAAAREVDAELEGLYSSAASLIGAHDDEIAFAENATRAWDMAFYGLRFERGDRILTSRTEYGSSYLAFLRLAQQQGVEIVMLPDAPDGTVDVNVLSAQLDDRVRLVSICHVPSSNGLCNDAEAVGTALRGHRALFFLDACQSVGQMQIDVRRIGCHVLSATGRKFLRGPRGTGFLYVRRDVLDMFEPPFIDLRAADWVGADRYVMRPDARRFETWESSIAGRLGLKAAIDYAREIGLSRIEARIASLSKELRSALATVKGVRVLDRGTRLSGIVTFVAEGHDAVALRDALAQVDVAVGAIELGDAWIDLEPGVNTAVLRASVHYFNTSAEICRFVEILSAVLAGRKPPPETTTPACGGRAA